MKTLPVLVPAIALTAWLAEASAQVIVESATRPIPTISVSGSAEVRVPPDEVLLTLGIENRDRSLDTAKNQNDHSVAALLEFLKGAGIDAKDIQTDHVGIQPQYQSGRQDVVEFYIVQRHVGLRLRRVGDFEKVLTGALKTGVTQVHGVEFRTTELRKHRDTARKLAIRAAREKANDLARELDARVGKVQSITESSWGGYWGSRGFGGMAQNVFQNAVAAEPPPEPEGGELSVGQISITATVNVSFQLETGLRERDGEHASPK